MAFPQWVSDGSPEINVLNSNEVECTKDSSSGNVFNALWKESEDGLRSGTRYWQVVFTDFEEYSSSPWIGLTDLSKFKQGWGLKGLMYGGPGNLSNGGALLIGSYGPGIKKSGDTVGMLVQIDDDKIKIFFDLNGQPLGLAFDVPRNTLDAEVFPAVHVGGPCKAKIQSVSDIPANLERLEPIFVGIEGDWKMDSYKGTTPRRFPTMKIKKLCQEGTKTSYSVYLHVLNNINFTLVHDEAGGIWSTETNRITTLMGGSPEDMGFESEINKLTTNPCKVDVGPDGNLSIVKDTIDSRWVRYSTAKQPVTTNPFE